MSNLNYGGLTMGLSKSKFLAYCQCEKRLWLETHRPELRVVDEATNSRFKMGDKVGDLAMGYFGSFEDVTAFKNDGSLDLAAMISNTGDCIKRGVKNICEASFCDKDGVYCAVDILHMADDGSWKIYEVKSSTDASKSVYIDDLACQAYVLKNCGVKVSKYCTMVIDNTYVYDGKKDKSGNPVYDLHKLFKITDLTNKVLDRVKTVPSKIGDALKVNASNDEIVKELGCHCNKPYPCAFSEYCKKCNGYRDEDYLKLYHGIAIDISKYSNDNYDEFVNSIKIKNSAYGKIHLLQVDFELNKRTDVYVEKMELSHFLKEITYPVYFLDFETMMPTLPLFANSRPFQQIPFQYSLHYIETEGGKLNHKEFLAPSDGSDPRLALAVRLVNDIPDNVCVLAYNKDFECKIIMELADLFPDLKDHLMAIHHNINDLIIPFRKGLCYNRAMGGSFSIKSVLPALFPNDPELDYSSLPGVHIGTEAMNVFPEIQYMDKEDQIKTRNSLLAYCNLDTLAMVRIWEKLIKFATGKVIKHII